MIVKIQSNYSFQWSISACKIVVGLHKEYYNMSYKKSYSFSSIQKHKTRILLIFPRLFFLFAYFFFVSFKSILSFSGATTTTTASAGSKTLVTATTAATTTSCIPLNHLDLFSLFLHLRASSAEGPN